MAKKTKTNNCKNCIFNGDKCQHYSNKGVVVKYRVERETYLCTPNELNQKGDCKNYISKTIEEVETEDVELSEQ